MVKGIVLGLLLGLPLGALIVHAVHEAAPSTQMTPLPGVGKIAERDHGAAPREPDGHATATLVGRPEGDVAEPMPATSSIVGTQREAMAQALRGKYWPAYHRALLALAAADTPDADRVLVSVLGDIDVVFPEPMSREFTEWLRDSEVDGIAEAIWRRIEIDVECFGPPRGHWVGAWAELLGRHAAEGDLKRLRSESEGEAYGRGVAAFLASGRPEALLKARRILEERYEPSGRRQGAGPFAAVRAPLASDFGEGVGVLEEEIGRVKAHLPSAMPTSRLLPLYAEFLPPEQLDDGKAWLLAHMREVERGVLDQHDMHGLLLAVAALRGRGLDTSGLEPIGLWGPRTVQDIVAAGGPAEGGDPRWMRALQTLTFEYPSNLMPLEERIAALEAALPYDQRPEQKQRLIQRLRARLLWMGDAK